MKHITLVSRKPQRLAKAASLMVMQQYLNLLTTALTSGVTILGNALNVVGILVDNTTDALGLIDHLLGKDAEG